MDETVSHITQIGNEEVNEEHAANSTRQALAAAT
jgi:hypothetical protein